MKKCSAFRGEKKALQNSFLELYQAYKNVLGIVKIFLKQFIKKTTTIIDFNARKG